MHQLKAAGREQKAMIGLQAQMMNLLELTLWTLFPGYFHRLLDITLGQQPAQFAAAQTHGQQRGQFQTELPRFPGQITGQFAGLPEQRESGAHSLRADYFLGRGGELMRHEIAPGSSSFASKSEVSDLNEEHFSENSNILYFLHRNLPKKKTAILKNSEKYFKFDNSVPWWVPGFGA
jgi:hypothetical protein